jgi:hypothetical protein
MTPPNPTQSESTHLHKATPDSFVGVAPVSWGLENTDVLEETHGLQWQEEVDVELEPVEDEQGIIARGRVVFEDDSEAVLIVEDPLDELHTLAGTSKEPYTPTEVIMLKDHVASWRFVVKGGTKRHPNAVRRFARLTSTFVEAGAAGMFLPGIVTLHSPRFIKVVTMDLDQPQNLTNLCVHAWNADDWMVTRGLTAFGLPELETPVDEGMNAAYFRLMDIAAGMISQNRPFPDGSKLTVGPNSYEIHDSQHGPTDEEVPFSGTFGVQSIQSQ